MNKWCAGLVATAMAVLTPLCVWAFIAYPQPYGLIGFVMLPAICWYALFKLFYRPTPRNQREALIAAGIPEWRIAHAEEWQKYIAGTIDEVKRSDGRK